MSLSVVNGYLCYSSCDELKARAGKDPHPKQDIVQETRNEVGAGAAPAVTYGGALAPLNAVRPVIANSTAAAAKLNSQPTSIDILA